MKKFLLKVSCIAIYFILAQIIFPMYTDPFNVFHYDNIRDNGVEPNKNYIKVKYILEVPDKFDGFIFGSSRVGAIHPENITTGQRIYNMTYSAGIPREHLDNIKTFLAHNVHPRKIYIGVDSASYTESYAEAVTKPLNCPYERLYNDFDHFCSLYLNAASAFQALGKFLTHSTTEKFRFDFYNYGYDWMIDYDTVSNYDWQGDVTPAIKRYYFLDSTLDDIREIVKLCKDNDIELIIFTNPMHYVTYKASLEKNYLDFLESLAEITDFYNFSGLNSITLDNNNYFEPSHYRPQIGDMIINVIFNGESYPELESQGFGVKVTRENIHDLIELLKAQTEIL